MKNLILDENEKSNSFIFEGNIDLILKNKILNLHFERFFKSYIKEGKILIPYNSKVEREIILQKLIKTIQKHKLPFNYSEKTNNSIHSILNENLKFSEFSKKAKDIRNDICDKKDFKNFVEIIDSNMKRGLYKLQVLSSYHLAFSQNACNFSVPGAGKTSVVYGAYTYLSNLEKENLKFVDKILIIGPLSSFGPWENEYESCFGKKPTIKRISGELSKEERKQYFYSFNPCEITLISYQSVVSIIDEIIYFLKNNSVMLVLDEAHKIKNTDGGIIAESVLKLSPYARSRVVLTGTPLPNGYQDLFNLYKFIWPNHNIIPYHLFQLKDMSNKLKDERINNLTESISPFFIRVKKSDLNLPKPIENEPIIIEMGKVQREIYNFIEKKYFTYLEKEDKNSNLRNLLVRARLIRLMQAATNPSLLTKPLEEYFGEDSSKNNQFIDDSKIINQISKYYKLETPPKFIKVLDIIKKIIEKGEKVILWCVFINNIDELKKFLNKNGINCKTLDGRTPIESENYKDEETREKIINEFHNSNSSFKVIIANPFAVSESISLHKACHNAIYVERTFNVSNFIQSKDRIHRYGLKKTDKINYYYLISKDSVDEIVHSRLIFKEERMNNIIEKEPIPLFSNAFNSEDSEDDIKALLEYYVKRKN